MNKIASRDLPLYTLARFHVDVCQRTVQQATILVDFAQQDRSFPVP